MIPISEFPLPIPNVSLTKRTIPFLIALGLFGLALAFTVGMLDPFIYSEKVRGLAPPGLKNTVLGFIPIMALLVALVVQPLMGRWSDRTSGRWGKRAPFLTGGSIGLVLFLLLIVAADSLLLLVVAAMGLSACSNTMQVAWQALIPDHVPEAQRGLATAIKTLLELVGSVTGIMLVLRTLAAGHNWTAPVTAAGLLLAILAVTLIVLRRSHEPARPTPPGRAIVPGPALVLGIGRVPSFQWWMLNRFLFWASVIAIRTFSLNYLHDVLSLSLAEAQAFSDRMLLVMGLGVLVVTLPAGALADRIGRRPLLVVAGLMAAGGTLCFVLMPNLNVLFIAGGLIAGGTGIYVSASWALVTDLVPRKEGALYLGLANGATVLGSISGRLGGPLIDGLNHFAGSPTTGYFVIFTIAALCFVGSSLAVLKIADGR